MNVHNFILSYLNNTDNKSKKYKNYSYSIINNSVLVLYHNGSLRAVKYVVNNKTIIFTSNISHNSLYEFMNKYNIILVNTLYNELQNIDIKSLIISAINYYIITRFNHIYHAIYNINCHVNYNDYKNIYNDLNILYDKISKVFGKRFINAILNIDIGKIRFIYYIGWKSHYEIIKLKYTYLKLIKNGLSKSELEIYNAKVFWKKYIYNTANYCYYNDIETSSLQNKIDIYNNIKIRDNVINRDKIQAENKLIYYFDWMKGINNIMPNIKNYNISKFVRLNSIDIINKSAEITIYYNNSTITNIKQSFKIINLFKWYEAINNYSLDSNYIHTLNSISRYTISLSNKYINFKLQPVLKIGCSTVSKDVIDLFFEINKEKLYEAINKIN